MKSKKIVFWGENLNKMCVLKKCLLGMNNSNKTPAVSPGAAPGWDPFGNNAQSTNQGIYHFVLLSFNIMKLNF